MSIGSRYIEGAVVSNPQPLYRRWWSRFANVIIQKYSYGDIGYAVWF